MVSKFLDKFAAVGSILAASMAACCFPALGVVGSALGLTAIAPRESTIVYAVQGLVLLSALGDILAFRRHQRWLLLLLGLSSAILVIAALQLGLPNGVVYGGLAGLSLAALLNTLFKRSQKTIPLTLESTLTCPNCGAKSQLTMPLNYCQILFECGSCKHSLRPLSGDCCVFCSFGDTKCPPKQNEDCCTRAA